MQAGYLLAAAGLASAWMLWWSAAAAIPILLHYLYRRRQRTIRWAAMQLLLQVVEREAKRVRLEQLLLLILRTLILVVLATALARPFWHSGDQANSASSAAPANNWIIAIDVSYSMGYRVDAESRLQTAQRRAAELVETANEGDAFAVVALGRPPRAAIASPTYDRQAVLTELGRLVINDAGCDLTNGLQLISDIGQRAQQDSGLPSQVHVLILSDLGREHWQASAEGGSHQALRQLGEKYPVEIEALGDETTENLAVIRLQPSALRVVAGESLQIDATVRNYGTRTVEQVPVQLTLDGNTLASQRVDLKPQTEQLVHFDFIPTAIGPTVLAVTLPTDRLLVDNTLRQVIDVRNDFGVLIVEQQAGESRVLRLSLRPDDSITDVKSRSAVSIFELSTIALEPWPVIILNDLASLDENQHARLERYVSQGGALICMLGPRSPAVRWNEYEAVEPLLGFTMLEPAPEQIWNIDPLEYKSPIVSLFEGFPDSGLLTTPIFRYWKIQPHALRSAPWNVDLAIEQGGPLIVTHRVGGGTVISLLSAPQSGAASGDNWNAMATWPSFVPLMQRLVQSAMDSGAADNTLRAGQPLVGKIKNSKLGNPSNVNSLSITKPDASETRLDAEEILPDGSVRWTFPQTQQSGVYLARQVSTDKQQPFAVNVDGSESSLQSMELGELPKLTAPPPAIEVPQAFSSGAESSPWLARGWLTLLGLLLLTESCLAWGLGRRVG